ncbi:MAG: carotenoid oxygenase family protein [Nostoc sp. NMS7]|uniref:carotenoid oxygenase family protein n=1 Tax=Nostoc sp. NMS7 TaxID=2815391 RepID=UPI0025D86241|nr:carotenoid oxygenase family protein [Nostoc sp. NMS7]MBN3947564.1 carotenoid oxygenase family protein [Nostoc sp. NMS7]
MFQELNNQFPLVPESIMNALRDEFIDNQIKMQIICGTLPDDLQGYVFIIAPVGNVDSQGLPYKDGNTFLSGDGMIYRFDFTQPDQVTLKTQIVKPPDYVADQEDENNEFFKFHNHGVVRFSYLLGSRNLLNTAFLPIKFPQESSERLLVTYDAGRPYEINTEKLSTGNPVGQKKEWKSAIPLPYPFNPILSTAHPAFDTYTHQMFTVNYGRSLSNFLGTEEGKEYQKGLNNLYQDHLKKSEEQKLKLLKESERKKLLLQRESIKILLKLIDKFNLFDVDDFVNLICWDDTGSLRKWNLINPDGSPIKIKQSMHQIGVTEDYVVLLDTSFTVGIEQIMSNCLPFPELFPLGDFSSYQDFSKWLRNLFKFTLKPSPDSTFYIVRREDLKEEENPVVVQKIEIPLEASHFLVDYKNPDRQITLHVAHICAWHVAEWLHSYDKSAYPEQPLNKKLYGMQQCEMDISRMGRYVIDVSSQKPTIASKRVIDEHPYTWGPGLFTYLDRLPSSGKTPERLDNIYWISFGLWEELMTDSMLELYKDYKYRRKPLEDVLELGMGKDGIPATLFRLDTSSNESMVIADSYQFPRSHIALSPQFIPRKNNEDSSTNGYILCFVFTQKEDQKEDQIWIFDAGDLKKGPRCKLHHPELNFGFSLHATWLQNISSQEPIRKFSVREDYQDSVENLLQFVEEDFSSFIGTDKEDLKKAIQDLFEKKIYPNFE